uniref:Tetratricopeptide repeat protein n=1 Tax=candidate division WOR-3 bacterium TaxID=2052148 RepID=A0A7C4TG58_UNCW3
MISPEEYKILKSFAERIPDNDPGAHNNLAVVYYNKGLYEEAIAELEKALSIDPNFLLARNNLEIILKKSGKLEDKVKELAHRIEAEPFDEIKTLELADTYRKLNRYSQAIIFYRKVLDFNPGSYEAHFGLGLTLKSLGKYDDALEEIKKSLEIKISPEGYRVLGEIYFNKGAVDLAIKNFQESLLLEPNSPETHFFLGFAYGEKGKHKEGREEIRKAIELNPALAQFEPNLPIEIKEHRTHLDFLKEQLGVPKAAVNEFQAHKNLGLTYRNKGLFAEAKREFDECLKLNKNDVDLFVYLGEISIFLGKLDDAASYFNEGLKLDPYQPKCANGLGLVFLKKNDYKEAQDWFEKSLAWDKSLLSALNNLAVVQILQNNFDDAINNFIKAKNMGNEEARYNLGIYYLKKGDYETILKLFNGEGIDDIFMRGVVFSELGRDEEAIASFQKIIAHSPNYSGAYYNLGFLLMKIGRFEEGLSYIRKGMEIEPNYERDKYRLSIAPELYEFGLFYHLPKFEEKLVEEVEEIFPKLEVPRPEDFILEAEAQLKFGNLEKALEMVDAALKINPEMVEAIILKGKILLQSNNPEDAINLLNSYTQKHPTDVESQLALAGFLKSLGRLKDAREKYYHLLELQNDNPQYLKEIAELSFLLDEIDEASITYHKLYSMDDRDIAANLGLLKVSLKKKELEKAKLYVDFLEKEGVDSFEFNLYGGIYWLEKNERERARGYLKRAIELEPSKPLPYYHLGLLLVNEGKFDEACSNWKKALLLSPDEELSNKISYCLRITMEMMEFLKKAV